MTDSLNPISTGATGATATGTAGAASQATEITSFQDPATGLAESSQLIDPSGSLGGAYGAILVNTSNGSTAIGVPAPSHIPTFSVIRLTSFPPH